MALSLFLKSKIFSFNKFDVINLKNLKELMLRYSNLFLVQNMTFKLRFELNQKFNFKTKFYNVMLIFKERLYFLDNSFTRASKIMSLCQVNFNSNYFNFKF